MLSFLKEYYIDLNNDVSLSQRHIHLKNNDCKKESVFAFLKGSMSLEASLVMPIFIFFLMTIIFSLEMIRLQSDVTEALHQEFCNIYEKSEEGILGEVFFEYMDLKKNPYRAVVGGRSGIELSDKSSIEADGHIFIEALFNEKNYIYLIPVLDKYKIVNDSFEGHAFTGFVTGFGNEFEYEEAEYVYVAENGVKYHRNQDCRYIKITPKAVGIEEINNLRNNGGGKYYPCERCAHLGAHTVYITPEGASYHGDAACPSLKRTLYMMTLKEATENGYTPCSNCG